MRGPLKGDISESLPERIPFQTGETEVFRGCVGIASQQNPCVLVHCLQCFLAGRSKGRAKRESVRAEKPLRGTCQWAGGWRV